MRDLPLKWEEGSGVLLVSDASTKLAGSWMPARNSFFTALVAACGVNGLFLWQFHGLQAPEVQMSWILYLDFGLALRALILAPVEPLRPADLAIGGLVTILLVWPLAGFALFAMTIVALYLMATEPRDSGFMAGALISLALTVTPLWGRVFPLFLAGPLERLDLLGVSLLTGSAADGNRMAFADGRGSVVVGWGCTSFANASLALLLWVALTRSVRPAPKRGEWLNLLAVFATVFVINTARLALTAQSWAMHDLVHGPVGAFWVNVLLLLSTIAWCAYGLRREILR